MGLKVVSEEETAVAVATAVETVHMIDHELVLEPEWVLEPQPALPNPDELPTLHDVQDMQWSPDPAVKRQSSRT
jgi:hypothetical protein